MSQDDASPGRNLEAAHRLFSWNVFVRDDAFSSVVSTGLSSEIVVAAKADITACNNTSLLNARNRGREICSIIVNSGEQIFVRSSIFGIRRLFFDDEATFISADFGLARQKIGSGIRVDKIAASQFLIFGYIPSDRTFIEGLRILQPGHELNINEKQRTRYWHPWKCPNQLTTRSEKTALFGLERLIDSALEQEYLTGASKDQVLLLSGGVDCRVIFHFLGRVGNFSTVTFYHDSHHPDLSIARQLRRVFDIPGIEVYLPYSRLRNGISRWFSLLGDVSENLILTLPNASLVSGSMTGKAIWLGIDHFSSNLPSEGVIRPLNALSPHTIPPLLIAKYLNLGKPSLRMFFSAYLEVLRNSHGSETDEEIWEEIEFSSRIRVWNLNIAALDHFGECKTPWSDRCLVEKYLSFPRKARGEKRLFRKVMFDRRNVDTSSTSSGGLRVAAGDVLSSNYAGRIEVGNNKIIKKIFRSSNLPSHLSVNRNEILDRLILRIVIIQSIFANNLSKED